MFPPYSPFLNFFSFNLEINVYLGLLFSFSGYEYNVFSVFLLAIVRRVCFWSYTSCLKCSALQNNTEIFFCVICLKILHFTFLERNADSVHQMTLISDDNDDDDDKQPYCAMCPYFTKY
jgi:hypothetical protein